MAVGLGPATARVTKQVGDVGFGFGLCPNGRGAVPIMLISRRALASIVVLLIAFTPPCARVPAVDRDLRAVAYAPLRQQIYEPTAPLV